MVQALIDFAPAVAGGQALRAAFADPVRVLRADQADQVRAVLDAVQAESRQGRWCVGFVRYEAAEAFDRAFYVHPADGPLAWFGVYDTPRAWPQAVAQPAQATWHELPDRAAFERSMASIQQAIADGEFYQLNHTARLRGSLQEGTPLDLFHALQRAQPGGFAAYLDTGEEQVLSVSPELFFDWSGDRLVVRPMKGTAPRGDTPQQDAQQACSLQESAKERAENVMIVDLIRNDLSRIAQPFSVTVPALFEVQALPSVWQMTSDVQARVRDGVTLADVFAALFPCGSVTGAPKVRAMQRIHELEPDARGVYCGAVGVVRPGGEATFNVAIRTVTTRNGQLLCGVGSAITADAKAEGEWREWRHKRAFVERASEPFSLLETMALDHGVWRHGDLHMARLARTAAHFAYPWRSEAVQACLQTLAQQHPQGAWRVRLLLDAQGEPQAQAFALEASPSQVTLALARQPLAEADSEFVRYKTTRRAHYDAAAIHREGVYDTLLWNERGELTECTRGNIAVQLDGQWWTPALSSGLLAGVGREAALADGHLREAVLPVAVLQRATGLAFLNNLRGWISARIEA